MDCCTKPDDEGARDTCPSCNATGVRVDMITLKALLNPRGLRRGIPSTPRFCATPTCPVIYFGAGVTFAEEDLSVRVHAKHPHDDEVPVCYCFEHTPGSMREELERTAKSTAFATISAEVRARHCACEVKNPKGSCCLGDVKRIEQRLADRPEAKQP